LIGADKATNTLINHEYAIRTIYRFLELIIKHKSKGPWIFVEMLYADSVYLNTNRLAKESCLWHFQNNRVMIISVHIVTPYV